MALRLAGNFNMKSGTTRSHGRTRTGPDTDEPERHDAEENGRLTVSESESDSGYLLDVPPTWFIGFLMSGSAILGFSVEGFRLAGSQTAMSAWVMAAIAVVAFAFPYLRRL